MKIAINISDLAPGSGAVVVGYSRVYGGYSGKLISQGLLPGTRFVILDSTMARGAVQIVLPEKIITLSKPEVNALCIAAIAEEDDDRQSICI